MKFSMMVGNNLVIKLNEFLLEKIKFEIFFHFLLFLVKKRLILTLTDFNDLLTW